MAPPHRYLPQSDAEREEMLRAVGVAQAADLFASIPASLRLTKPLDVPGPLAEMDLQAEMAARAAENRVGDPRLQFLGGGAYRHFAPSAVDHLVSRTEFYSSYTPYQPEITQGTLQAVFEYQTLIAQLTGLDIANASMYEGASSLAEAVLMTERVSPRGRVLISDRVHPEYLQVVRTYLANMEIAVETFGGRADGTSDPDAARKALATPASALVVQHPNFLGCLEEVEAMAAAAHEAKAALIVTVNEPLSMALLKSPGSQGADVVVGEAQGLGVPLSYGGPYLGFLAARATYLRQMPGRLVGEAKDVDGRRGYVLTLSTREQHIRREKATSNICTNEGLCALTAAIYMASLGGVGLRDLARQNHARAAYARERLAAVKGVTMPHTAPFFNEFVVRLPGSAARAVETLAGLGIAAGIPLSRYVADRDRDLLVAVTETNPRTAIDRLADEIARLG
ncbi:MAG TPA: aminomethyl-transferring glycine dehydrogenase subunit GcvPA [Candidatus Polarisedimenticolia bacterium]|nr:aminomethyl-transferring glycine dehydrogenase subunit GcvPA [Candidatus Polarisedimenticolia bacterium]